MRLSNNIVYIILERLKSENLKYSFRRSLLYNRVIKQKFLKGLSGHERIGTRKLIHQRHENQLSKPGENFPKQPQEPLQGFSESLQSGFKKSAYRVRVRVRTREKEGEGERERESPSLTKVLIRDCF